MTRLTTPARTPAAAASAAIAIALIAALAGCGGGTPKPAAVTTPTPAVAVPTYVAADNARKQVTATTCAKHGAKGWELTGKATNTTSSPHGFSIVVDFVTRTGDTVVDTKIVKIKPLPPDASTRWMATGAPGHTGVTCVIRQALAHA